MDNSWLKPNHCFRDDLFDLALLKLDLCIGFRTAAGRSLGRLTLRLDY